MYLHTSWRLQCNAFIIDVQYFFVQKLQFYIMFHFNVKLNIIVLILALVEVQFCIVYILYLFSQKLVWDQAIIGRHPVVATNFRDLDPKHYWNNVFYYSCQSI